MAFPETKYDDARDHINGNDLARDDLTRDDLTGDDFTGDHAARDYLTRDHLTGRLAALTGTQPALVAQL